MLRRFLPVLLVSLAPLAIASAAAADLGLEERVELQTRVERVRYAHQIGRTVPFEAAVPRSLVERTVRRYLKESVALEAFWRTEVTSGMLRAETERMAAGTRMPERLRELFAALGDDPVALQECLARPLLVDRLVRSFYAGDVSLHERERTAAESLERDLARLGAAAFENDPRRTEITLVLGEATPEEFARERARAPAATGVVGPVREEADAFVVRVVLEEGPGFARIATFAVPKRPFDDWWEEASAALDPLAVRTVADPEAPLPVVSAAESCPPEDSWTRGTLGGPADPRTAHAAVWTGTQMIVWGGLQGTTRLASGARYDPATDTWSPTSTVDAPSARSDLSAVWTGARMVVWGGYVGGVTYLSSGARYDPVADAWSPTSGTGAPSPRSNHTAIWTGTQMIVWGGIDAATVLQSGARYDPAADTWTATATTGAPAGRAYHTAVWTGSRMVIWGGDDNDLTPLSSGSRYDPVANTWSSTSTSGAPVARDSHTAVWTGSRMVVWGGVDASAIAQSTGGQYDPAANVWTSTDTANAPAARGGHAAVWTGSRMIVWGGASGSELDTGSSYDPVGNAWTPLSSAGAPRGRTNAGAVWTGTRMIVWGGERGGEAMNTGGRYDPASDTWTPTSMLGSPGERQDPRGVWTGNLVVVWGGYSGLVNGYLQTGGRYDPATDSWTPTSLTGAPEGRRYHVAVWTGSSMIVWGGWNGITIWTTGGRYDPVSDTWTPTSTTGVPSGRLNASAVWTGSRMVIWGAGFNTGGRYDPATDTWTATSTVNAPAARTEQRAVWTGSRMIVWGGFSGTNYFTAGGQYDPVADTWTATSTVNVPAGRRFHAAAWTGSKMIVWGGAASTGGPINSGGVYDPVADTWTATSTTGAPSARYDHTAVWTGRSVVVWGGYNGAFNGYLGDGGRYDPATDTWATVSLTGAPTPRRLHFGVWTGSEMIVWGGLGASGTLGTGGAYAIDAAAPAGSPALTVSRSGSDAVFAWAPLLGATAYDAVEGGLLSLRSSGGDFTSSVLTCLANDDSATSVAASGTPTPGDGFWVLVRGEGCGGIGTYDEGSASQQGSRDAEIAASANACP
jgi:N-acetylneuraminic acid mutarotase